MPAPLTTDTSFSPQSTSKLPTKPNWKQLVWVLSYVSRYRGIFAIGLVFLFFSTATTLVFPYFGSMLADAALGKAPYSIRQIGVMLAAVLLLQGFFSYMRIWLFSVVTEKSMADLRIDLYNRLITLPVPFFEQHRIGELTSRLTSDIAQLQSALSVNLAELLRQIATLIVGIAIIAYTSLRLSGIMLAVVPLAVITAMFLGKYIRRLSKETQDALAEANVVAEETLQSIHTVKAFTNESYEAKRYQQAMQHSVTLALRTAQFRGAFITFLISAVFGGIILVLWYGATLVQAGEMTVGELLRFILYTFFIGGAIGGMGDLYSNLLKSFGASERVGEILQLKPELELPATRTTKAQNDTTTNTTKHTSGNGYRHNALALNELLKKVPIVYQDVRFSYPSRPDLPVLHRISLHIQPGTHIALVGQSGAGKSTIAQLLQRYYAVQSGAIKVGDIDIADIDLHTWRSQIGIVPQEVLLFGGTIAENIGYGKPNATEAEIAEAARQANALSFIQAFPDGMNTVVGERGIKLSGGQRQRIAIARAMLKNPAILILDEATSSLDAESEHLVQSALQTLMQDRTTIIIAHRLSTIRNADCIYVLDSGKIAEQGTHHELAARIGGIYHNLLQLQLS